MRAFSQTLEQLVFGLLSPLLCFYNAFQAKSRRITTIAGTLFMGFAGSVYVYIPGNDGATHLEKVNLFYRDMTLQDFLTKAFETITFQSTVGSTDLYLHTISYLSGSIFHLPELLHVFAGLVLGYFVTKSALLVIRENPWKRNSFLLLCFIGLFLIVRSVSALNSIRMWTAMWVFFYGSYGWVLTKKPKYLWVVGLAALIHFSYFIFFIPLGFAWFFRKRKLLIAVVFLLSFGFTLNYGAISGSIPDLPLLEEKEKSYIEVYERKTKEKPREDLNFYKKWGELVYTNYSLLIVSGVLLVFYFKRRLESAFLFLIASGLTIYAFSNIVTFAPSLSGRAKTIAGIYLVAALIYGLYNFRTYNFSRWTSAMIRITLWGVLMLSIPVVLFHISYIMNTLSVFIIAAPIASWLLGGSDLTIREAIGDII